MEIRLLKASEIECRIGTMKDKNNAETGYSLLLYKNARVDMAILDELYGTDGWQRDHKEIKGNVYCGIGIRTSNGEWVWKWDCGKESNTESEKGEASDSFKRAGFNVGIGRELYTAPFIWVKGYGKYEKFSVSKIDYDKNRNIIALEILDSKGNVAYSMGKNVARKAKAETKEAETKPEATTATPKQIEYLLQIYQGDLMQQLLEHNNIDKLEDLPIEKASHLIELNKKRLGGK